MAGLGRMFTVRLPHLARYNGTNQDIHFNIFFFMRKVCEHKKQIGNVMPNGQEKCAPDEKNVYFSAPTPTM
jgi:hypothetical protein